MRRIVLVLSLAAAPALVAGCKPSPQAEAAKAAAADELKSLDGRYKLAGKEGSLSEDEDVEDMGVFYVFEAGTLRVEYQGADGKPEVVSRRKATIDATKSPKTIDLTYVDEAGKEIKERKTKRGITGKRKTVSAAIKDVGIYKLDGDKLELCVSGDEKARPTDFTAPAKSSRYLVKLERVSGGPAPATAASK